MQKIASVICNDKGAILVIGLLTVVLLSLIGVSATTTSRVEVQISGNDKASKEAFYAAEVGLTTGETTMETLPGRIEFDEGTTVGHYGQGTEPAWNALKWDATDSVVVPTANIPTGLSDVAAPPRYAIEQRVFRRDSLTTGIGVSTGVYLFNVTAQGTGGSKSAEMVLQTIYARRFN